MAQPRGRRSLLFAALVAAVPAGWFPFVAWRERRSDAQVQAHVQALVAEGLPVELAALEERPARDAGPLVEALLARLEVTDVEVEAARAEDAWRMSPGWSRTPDGPPAPTADAGAERAAIVARLLARFDAELPALDALLGCDGCSVRARPAWAELGRLLRLRALVRADAPLGLAHPLGRLAALLRDPTWDGACLQSSSLVEVALHVELALSRAPLDPAVVPALDEALRRAERPDALSVALRCELLPTLSYLSADRAAFGRLGAEGGNYLAYLEDRPRWARLQADAVRAAGHSLREVERRFEELGAEARASGGPVSALFVRRLPRPSTAYEHRARTRLARMALAWAATGLTTAPPLQLEDPLADPPGPLRWRRDGDRFTLWSVGTDGKDDGAPDEGEVDLTLRVTLPVR